MASPSPAVSNSNSGDTLPATTEAAPTLTPSLKTPPSHHHQQQQRPDIPKTQRGQNKPKCASCGNVARSKCPFHSCKSCCSKARNPCAVHEKTPTSSSSLVEKSPDIPSSGATGRNSIRQLSANFNQFNNVQVHIRSRKPPTQKEAAVVNQWRYSKLKEYNERNAEVGDEAFDRYIHNIRLLEEIFHVKSDSHDVVDAVSMLIPDTISSPIELPSEENNGDAVEESNKRRELRNERYLALNEVNEKLSRVRSEDDVKSCRKMSSEIFLGRGDEDGGRECIKMRAAYSIPGKNKQLWRREIEQRTLDELEKCSGSSGMMEMQAL